MKINPQQKGKQAEREIARMLNRLVSEIRLKNGLKGYLKCDELFQRNQNQSAVGGSDISNLLGLAIEVKRQETLSIDSWWKQCCASAGRTKGIPVLMFRQSRKPWRVCLPGHIPVANGLILENIKVEINLEVFCLWFEQFYTVFLSENEVFP